MSNITFNLLNNIQINIIIYIPHNIINNIMEIFIPAMIILSGLYIS